MNSLDTLLTYKHFSNVINFINSNISMPTLKRLVPGDGKSFPQYGQVVRLHYTALFAETKTKIDSSRDRGVPFEFKLGAGEVIHACDAALPQLSVG